MKSTPRQLLLLGTGVAKRFKLFDTSGPIVYFLMRSEKVVYVGKTKNPQRRVIDHLTSKKKFDDIWYEDVTEDTLDAIEVNRIQMFSPKYNVHHKQVCAFDKYYRDRENAKQRLREMQEGLRATVIAKNTPWMPLFGRERIKELSS